MVTWVKIDPLHNLRTPICLKALNVSLASFAHVPALAALAQHLSSTDKKITPGVLTLMHPAGKVLYNCCIMAVLRSFSLWWQHQSNGSWTQPSILVMTGIFKFQSLPKSWCTNKIKKNGKWPVLI